MKEQAARKPSIHRFHNALVKFGIDVETLYAQLNISPDMMTSGEDSLSMDSYFSLINHASKLSRIRFLAASLAPLHESEDMGILVYLIRNARNFEHALDVLRRYITLVSPGAEISLVESETDYLLTYQFSNTPPSKCYQDVEGTLVQFSLMIRDVLHEQNWEPERVYFAHSAKAISDAEKFPVGKSVVFDHPFSGVAFPKNIIQYPIANADPKLLSILESQVLQSTTDLMMHDSLTDRVRLLITSGLGSATMTSDGIAHALGMSRRTLYRRLQESGTTYNALREDVVLGMARASLTNSSAPITHIAQELGYSDASAFNRVFKRLAGTTPLQYRKSHSSRL
jgi:AraC-like DNA-binding protein